MLKISRIFKAAEQPDISDKFPPQLINLLQKLNSFGEFYLVGGCIRDALLGRTPKDFDIMVVRPTPEELEKVLPVQKVGASFPVYLYDTGDPVLGTIEFAYARKETKTGIGYKGFSFEVVSDVKEDLARRDLTINALAWNPESGLVSFDDRSLSDVQTNTLRHVTDAFAEDPLRVFRAARFSAQLPGNWKVDPDTIELMTRLKGELPSLALDRVRIELEKSLKAPKPGNFFLVLSQADCMDYWFPEIEKNIQEAISLVNTAAKKVDLIGMYCLLGQAMGSSSDIKSFCKRLSLAWEREMSQWNNLHGLSFNKPEDYLYAFRASRQGKMTLDLLAELLKITGKGSVVPSILKAISAVKGLNLTGANPKEIPGIQLQAIQEAI